MAKRTTFKAITPKLLKSKVFRDAYADAAREVVKGIAKDFSDATSFFKAPPVWNTFTRVDAKSIYMSVSTTSIAFKYYDQGNGGPTRIIRPKRASVLHWVDTNGEDVFVKWVHGYEGRKVTETVRAWWDDLMPEYFGKHLALAAQESGHKL
jgi:hypothetical protein